jgi:uncharacterized membrane protein (UPF0127 family)
MLRYKNKIIARKIVYCDSVLRQGTGLMFRTRSSVNDAAWIFTFKKKRRIAITMFFVFFPIDVVFVDEKDAVIELKESLKPFSHYTSKSEIFRFLELKSGTIQRYDISRGSKIFID